MCEHCPVCDLKAAQASASSAGILFIPAAALLGLNGLKNISENFILKPQNKKHTSYVVASVDGNSVTGES